MKNGCLLVIIAFLLCLIALCSNQSNHSTQSVAPVVQKTEQEKIESQFSLWDGSHYELTKFIKQNMNDPGSYTHVSTHYWKGDNGNLIVRTVFRGKNAFGAIIQNAVEAEITLGGVVIKTDWK